MNRREALRYAGCKECSKETLELFEDVCREAQNAPDFRVCYVESGVSINGEECTFDFASVRSKALCGNLKGCESAVVFAATAGIEIDRLVKKYSETFPSRSLLLGALGSERVETLCDRFNSEIREEKSREGLSLKQRFSPGYGDLALSFQRDIFSVLDCPRQIGVTLNESLLMSPIKSVTAIIGIYRK